LRGTAFSLFILAGLALGACSPVRTRPAEDALWTQAYQSRAEKLGTSQSWALSGRLAISDGKDGGSGSLSWSQEGQETMMSFRGALGKGAWQLQSDADGARLELADGAVSFAPSVRELVLEHVGWKVPVDALAWWIKGLAQPGKWEARTLDEEGRLIDLRQSGWEVKFANYSGPADASLPRKLSARRGPYLVKMVVREWTLGPEVLAVD